MKVHAQEQAAPQKSMPAPGEYRRVLQQLGASLATARKPTPPGHALPPPANKPSPQLGAGRPAQPSLLGARLAGTAVAAGPVLATSRSALATPENLGQVRQAMNSESLRLRVTRAEAQSVFQERTEHRLSELISRELARELPSAPVRSCTTHSSKPAVESAQQTPAAESLVSAGEARHTLGASGAAPTEAADAPVQVQAAMELIEKIELFVRSQRPALRLSLAGTLAATVEVERTGPREVSLRIQGKDGPLDREQLTRIRDGLEARGLRLRYLRAE